MIASVLLAAGVHHASAGAPSALEWVLVAEAALVMVWTLGLAIRYTVAPGETNPNHIKHRILIEDAEAPEEGRQP